MPLEGEILATVLKEKNFSSQSCQGRCFLEKRKENLGYKTCFCDKACKTVGDCCLDFHSRCGHIENGADNAYLNNMTCEDINHPLKYAGVIMKSSCSLHNFKSTNDCQTAHRLNMTLQKELPVFDSTQNVTYRSIACARCHSEGNLSYWGLDISCPRPSWSLASPINISAVQKFLKKNTNCSWKYAPVRNRKQYHQSCVLHDAKCASTQLPMMSLVKELCYSYSMIFAVFHEKTMFTYRNPHCALCNPEGHSEPWSPFGSAVFPPWTILLDVGSSILHQDDGENLQQWLNFGPATQEVTSQVFNCTSTINNCTVSFEGQICKVFSTAKNQSTQMQSSLNESRVILMRSRQMSFDKNAMDLEENTVYILCLEHQAGQAGKDSKHMHGSSIIIYFTSVGTLLSIISLCFLLGVYLMFKELRNLPGKCLINLSFALLCFQTIFLGAAKSKEVDVLCKAVAILLHFFILAAFSWMSVMAFDTANTFKVQVRGTRKQPSEIRKTFIKYYTVGWGLPAVIVAFCSALDFTGTFHFGYGNLTYCWISDKTAKAVGMVTPVSLALIFNIVCLTKNIHAIRRLQQGASLATNNNSRASLTLICIKLTTVMGLTWILGLIANWKQTAFLQYPSTVLNSMQGFFIALCFTTTKKVRGLLKERFYKRWNGAAEPQASVSRDHCTRNTDVETATGSNSFDMKRLSREQARQNSS
ncbi:hypothetical protein ACROYT_G023300 [Oculina patagonica]